MCGIVTLLGDPFKSQVESLWSVLNDECGLSGENLFTLPHFSLQVAEGYDLAQLLPIMNEIASEIQPFKVHTTGLGFFSGEKPVFYIALAKDSQLLHYHEEIWKRVSLAGSGINPLYAPPNWMPHITLAHDNLNHEKLNCLMERLASQPFNWELQIDNIAYICQDNDGRLGQDVLHFQLQGSDRKVYPQLPLPDDPRSALVIVDMQEYFFSQPERRQGLDEVIQNINHLIKNFDENNLPVVHAVSSYRADRSNWDLKMIMNGNPELLEGDAETQILPQIHVSERHKILNKIRYSAFFNTDLVDFMNADNVHRVVVVGAYTHYCVNATVFDAYAHDFVPCLVTDAVISHLDIESEMIIDRMRRNGYHILDTSEFLKE